MKATLGVNEVISTIMLNWIAIWGGVWLFGLGGPLQDPHQSSVPTSSPVAASAKLPVFWGNASLQGLDIGLFIALGAAVVFWVLLNRTRFGYEVRAVGLNPDAASYAGISVPRSYFRVMAICGAFAGLAAAMDILGWKFSLFTNDIQFSTVGFIGIAVALLGRNSAVGVVFAALLFGALETGTSDRYLDPKRVRPEPGLEPHLDDPGPDRAAGLDRRDRAQGALLRPRHQDACSKAAPNARRPNQRRSARERRDAGDQRRPRDRVAEG